MTRIVAGVARGRRLVAPPGRDTTRPTSDRVRESYAGALEARLGSLAGLGFLDLYAGSGAVGLEALSRGAYPVLLVDSDRAAAAAIRRNLGTLADLGGSGRAELRVTPVEQLAASPSPRAYDLAYLDPPYALPAASLAAVLTDLARYAWLAPGALVVVERSARDADFPWPAGFEAERSRRYGDTALWYATAPAAPPARTEPGARTEPPAKTEPGVPEKT